MLAMTETSCIAYGPALVRRIGWLLLLLVPLALAGCESDDIATDNPPDGTGDGTVTPLPDNIYAVGPGDELNVIIFGHPDLSGNYVVDPQGSITMPLVGRLAVTNVDVDQVTQMVRDAYDGAYLVEPRVSVEILNSRPFYILGQVNEPGEYPYSRGVTVRQAVAIAGGFTRRADTAEFLIYRGGQNLEVNAETIVLPGDTVEVQRRLF